jgi:MarR family 2-MHQ and catechol resistance regulon transcriptional repressor
MDSLKTLTILFRAHSALQERIKADVSKYDLNVTEFGVLEALHHKGPLSIQAIQSKVLVAASSMTYVIRQLQNKGWVEKSVDDEDRRISRIQLSEKGRQLMETVYPQHALAMRQFLNVLSPKDETNLQTALKRIGLAAKMHD